MLSTFTFPARTMAGCIFCLTTGFSLHVKTLAASDSAKPSPPTTGARTATSATTPNDTPANAAADSAAIEKLAETAPPIDPAPRPAVPDRGYLGVTLTEICPEVRAQTTLREGEGLMIGRVAPDSPASKLGLHHFDILTRFNDQWLMSPAQFVTLVENAGPDAEVELTYLRRGSEVKSKVKLGRAPAHPIAETTVAPPVEEMLTAVIRTLRDNPAVLESVHRALHGLPPAAGETEFDSIATALKRGARLTLRDDAGEVELTQVGEVQQVRAWNTDGQLIFQGPCETPEQLAALPEGLKPRVERLQQECRKSIHGPAAATSALPAATAPALPATAAPAATRIPSPVASPDKSQAGNQPANR